MVAGCRIPVRQLTPDRWPMSWSVISVRRVLKGGGGRVWPTFTDRRQLSPPNGRRSKLLQRRHHDSAVSWGLEMFTFPAPNGALHTSLARFDKMDDDVRVPSAPKWHRMPAPKPRRTGIKDWHLLCKCEGPTPPPVTPPRGGSDSPEGGDGGCPDSVAEGEGFGAVVEDDAHFESVAGNG